MGVGILTIQLSALPLMILTIFGAALSTFLLIYWNSFWKLHARSYFRVTLMVTLVSIVQILFMSIHDGTHARDVYSFALPLVLLEQIAAMEAFMVTFWLRRSSWMKVVWGAGLFFLVISVMLHDKLYPVLRPVPDGYFFASPKSAVVFTALKSVVYCVSLLTLIAVVAVGLQRQGYRKRWVYGLSILVYVVCLFNDSVILQKHVTWYPTAWVAAVLLYVMILREVHWHMEEVYGRLDRDRLTGAYSRSFGENYLPKLLERQNVGIFYADIDHFKYINDTFGHKMGDQVLKKFVDLAQPLMAMPNAIIRLGGDEFLFVFPGVEMGEACSLRIQLDTLFGDAITMDDGTSLNLRVSLGWAYANQGASWRDIIHAADTNMYADKALQR